MRAVSQRKKSKGKGATTEEAKGEGEGEGEGKPAKGVEGRRAWAKASMEEIDDMMNELAQLEGKGRTHIHTRARAHGRRQRSHPKATPNFTPEI